MFELCRNIYLVLHLRLMQFWYNEFADTAVVGMSMPWKCDYLSASPASRDAHYGQHDVFRKAYEEGTGLNG